MLTVTESVPQRIAPNLNEAFPRTTSKPELGEIVVFTDNRSDPASILEFAGLVAEANGARLINVFIQPASAVTLPQTFARGTGIQDVIASAGSIRRRCASSRNFAAGMENLVSLEYRGSCASVLRRPRGYWPPRARYPCARAFRPRGISGFEFRPANHFLSGKPPGVSGPSHLGRLDRHARGHPGRSGCPAAACSRRSCTSLDR